MSVSFKVAGRCLSPSIVTKLSVAKMRPPWWTHIPLGSSELLSQPRSGTVLFVPLTHFSSWSWPDLDFLRWAILRTLTLSLWHTHKPTSMHVCFHRCVSFSDLFYKWSSNSSTSGFGRQSKYCSSKHGRLFLLKALTVQVLFLLAFLFTIMHSGPPRDERTTQKSVFGDAPTQSSNQHHFTTPLCYKYFDISFFYFFVIHLKAQKISEASFLSSQSISCLSLLTQNVNFCRLVIVESWATFLWSFWLVFPWADWINSR